MAVQRRLERQRGGFELGVELAQRGGRGHLCGGQVVRNGADDQQGHRAVQHVQRVAAEVEEEDVTQTEHQPRHCHRHETEHAQRQVEAALAAGFLHQVSASEDQHAADQRRAQRHLQAVAVGQPATAGGLVELIVIERQRQVVRPELHQRRKHRHAEHQQQRRADQHNNRQIAGITHFRRRWFEYLRTATHGIAVTAAQPGIDAEAEQRRQQQHHADQRPASELLLTDHGFVGFQRQHLIVAADHHRHTEIGDGQGEHQAERGEHCLPGRRPGDAAKGFRRTGAHARRRIEQPRIGQRQRRQQNHQRMGKGVDHLTQHNAPETVDIVREQPAQHALVAEQINQCDTRQHRRRHQWQQGNPAPEALGWNQCTLQGVGKQVGQRYDDGRDAEGNFQAVTKQPVEILAGHQLLRGEPATALPGLAAEAAPEDRQQRQQHRDTEQQQQQEFAAEDEDPVTDLGPGHSPRLLVR